MSDRHIDVRATWFSPLPVFTPRKGSLQPAQLWFLFSSVTARWSVISLTFSANPRASEGVPSHFRPRRVIDRVWLWELASSSAIRCDRSPAGGGAGCGPLAVWQTAPVFLLSLQCCPRRINAVWSVALSLLYLSQHYSCWNGNLLNQLVCSSDAAACRVYFRVCIWLFVFDCVMLKMSVEHRSPSLMRGYSHAGELKHIERVILLLFYYPHGKHKAVFQHTIISEAYK